MQEVMELSMGNPGAMNCVMGMISPENAGLGIVILPKVKELGIKGTDLYILWSDISQKDYGLMAHLCKSAPSEALINASSKQDYSGRELLKDYIDSYTE